MILFLMIKSGPKFAAKFELIFDEVCSRFGVHFEVNIGVEFGSTSHQKLIKNWTCGGRTIPPLEIGSEGLSCVKMQVRVQVHM